MAARMMRMCGGALMGRKEQEGLGRTERWGRQVRWQEDLGSEDFFCFLFRGEQRSGKIFLGNAGEPRGLLVADYLPLR